MSADLAAQQIIQTLGLSPHPEGGWFREMFRDAEPRERAASTAIYYLLEAHQASAWHRVLDAAEVWHHYAGAPLRLRMGPPDGPAEAHLLGPDLLAGQRPQLVVARGWWQAAEPLGGWVLAGCTVAPGFEFAAFEMAPTGWAPGQA